MEDKPLPLSEHLEELRRRIIISILSIIIAALISYFNIKQILNIILSPVGKLVFINPVELFFSYLKLALFCGILFSAPVTFYQLWKFIGIALKKTEKTLVLVYAPFSLLLFILGALFAYFLAIPLGLKFLLGLATENIVPMISVSKYISFLGILLLTFGLLFELPLVIMFLTKLRIITPEFLILKRKYAVVATFIAGAFLTPPDIFTQFLLAIPLILLYEISILCAKLISLKNLKSAK